MFEGFPAFCTFVGLLFSVELLVPITVGPGSEAFPTQAALVRPLSSVDLPVLV